MIRNRLFPSRIRLDMIEKTTQIVNKDKMKIQELYSRKKAKKQTSTVTRNKKDNAGMQAKFQSEV